MPFCFVRSLASATRVSFGRGGSRERGYLLRTDPSARFYELMAISVPDGTPEELIETSDSISGYIVAAGGRVLRSSNESPWGRRRLAYPIRNESTDLRDGFYTLYHFEIEPNRIEDIEREMRLNERIIRHLLLQLDSEPIFVEEDEDVITTTDPVTGEVTEVTETVVVADAPSPGVAETADNVEVVVADAAGEAEVVAQGVVVDVIAETDEVEAVMNEEEVATVAEAVEIEAKAEEAEVVKVEEK